MQRICSKRAERRIWTTPATPRPTIAGPLAAVPRFCSFKYLKSRHLLYEYSGR
jgi:hypothetical protein